MNAHRQGRSFDFDALASDRALARFRDAFTI